MAVYTDVSADDLADFLSEYELGELLSYKGIAEGVENSNFLIHTARGHFILTLYEKRVAPEDLPLAAAAVKAYSARILEEATEALIQLHGGIGFTWEHDAHLYWRRAKVDRLLLGDEAEHLDRVAELAISGGRL